MIKKPSAKAKAQTKLKPRSTAAKKISGRASTGGGAVMRQAATGGFRRPTTKHQEETQSARRPQALELSPVGAALRTFQRVATVLRLDTNEKLALLGLKQTKFFNSLKEIDPDLPRDAQDRLGYFLVIVDLATELVGDAGDWLRADNRAPVFGGQAPLDLLLAGRTEGALLTLNYLRSIHGGWA